VVHLVRHSLNFCSWKDRKAVAAKLREVYVAETAEAAWDALEAFDADWGGQYPSIARPGAGPGRRSSPFFAFSPEIRRVIYTTNAIESLNRIIRKAIKTRGS
ncbi:IS256 family transposase, partial [Amaricoccus sp. HAR-UPW-R2A-40]